MIRTISHRMLIPQILAAMTGTLCMLIDNLMIGQLLGDCELSAYGFSTPLIIVIASIGLMMANGVQMECSRAIGRGDLYDANSCYSTSIAMSVLVGSVIIIIVFAFCDQFCYILGAGSSGGDAQVFAQTSGYIRGYVPGIIFMFFYCLTGPYLQTMGKRKVLMASVITVIISDLVLNYVFAAVLHMRMFGIGIASSLSCLLAVLLCLRCFFSRDCLFRFSFRGISMEKAAGIIRNGSPIIISQVLYVLRVYCINIMLFSLAGNDAVAALSVVNSIANLLYCIGLGGGSVMLMLSSLLYNENDKKTAQRLSVRLHPIYTHDRHSLGAHHRVCISLYHESLFQIWIRNLRNGPCGNQALFCRAHPGMHQCAVQELFSGHRPYTTQLSGIAP